MDEIYPAIFVACLGLFGLTSFSVEQRTKEIGIRKVLGASESGLVLMISGKFIWLVLLANLVACPLAYWMMNQWLANFVYRIDVGVMPFVMGGLFTFAIALTTVGFKPGRKRERIRLMLFAARKEESMKESERSRGKQERVRRMGRTDSYLICATPRTGSTLLCGLLTSTEVA
ncbi:MAG: Stf0 family sulfotransferase, partial [Gemmatimonadota bacterium]|nr:Stf0 family sulfotransferase [Gemmatimonadota bacterium]